MRIQLADEVIGPTEVGYLRPWMCDGRLVDARVLLIGANPATPFPTAQVPRESYFPALTRGGRPLQDIYDTARAAGPSPTPRNIARVVGLLHDSCFVSWHRR